MTTTLSETATPSGTRAPSEAELLSAVEALRPLVEAGREALLSGPDLPPPLAEALRQAGLAQLWLPRTLGGWEIDPGTFVRVIEALARLDGSLAWCAAVSSNGSRFPGLAPIEPMRRLLPPGEMYAFSGSGRPGGTMSRDGDGWRINGRWSFASLSRSSSITFLMCIEQEKGELRRGPEGAPVLRAAFIPSSQVEVVGNWKSGGLRASGSHDITCTDGWVPADLTTGFTGGLEAEHRTLGPLFRLPLGSAFAIATAGIPLGIAAASIDALVALARDKTAMLAAAPLREQEHVQLDVAWAKTRLLAARAFVLETVEAVWESVSGGEEAPSVEQQALVRMAVLNAGEAAREVVGKMYMAAGSTAVLESAPFSAQLRDVYAACQHINFAARMMVSPGRILLGLEPGSPMI